ncbi:polyprenyl synthetase family protein [Saccharothrix sp. BKS2]|uniref:polyprenyl synthetase family protein n=1 Tax=Saccharothrix sp. BKS2 TaxID=3064400 RepID=UPI0039ED2FC1
MWADQAASPYPAAAELVAADLAAVEERLAELIEQQSDYLDDTDLAFYRQGKRLRPLLLLLSAHAVRRDPVVRLPDKAVIAAVSLELVHVGSLIHDDIVDRAPLRRGLPTLGTSRGYDLALVLGDLHWAQSARVAAAGMRTPEDIELLHRFLAAAEQTCRGQLDEMLKPRGEGTDFVRRYYRTVDRKTGQLITFACESGARLGGGLPAAVGCLRRFGFWLGRAFQVMDDVLDVVRPTPAAGKVAFADLRQGRLSLPLLYELEHLPRDHFLWRLAGGGALTDAELDEGVLLLRYGEGWGRAYADARAVVAKACTELSLIEPGVHREALHRLARHVVDQGFLDSHGVHGC